MSSKKAKPVAQTQQDFPVIQSILFFFMILIAMMVGANYLKEDLPVIMKWWAGILAVGIAFYPLAALIFKQFHDGGYVIGKAIGIAISSWLVWGLSTFKVAKFSQTSIIAVIVFSAMVNYGLYIFFTLRNNKKLFAEMTASRISYIVYFEAFFLLAFMLLCYVKSFKVTITSDTEKYMDFGFLASIMNTDYMPPKDMWFEGQSINYYYYGIYIAGFLGKLCGTTAGYAYNLDLMTIAALGGSQVYSLVMELVYHGSYEHEKRVGAVTGTFHEVIRTLTMNAAGLIGSLAVIIGGNGHYILYGRILPAVASVFKLEMVKSYWFPNSTRYIQDGGANGGYLIHEFPSYSFVLGDLHAHVTDIMFVVAIMSILFAFHLSRKEQMEQARMKGVFADFTFKETEAVNGVKTYWSEALNPCIIVAAFFVGIFKITNFWDFPIYFVVSGAMILFSNAIICGFNQKSLILTAVHAVEFLVISTLVALPFTLHFDSMTSGIRFAEYHSSPFKLFVLWGLPICVCIGLFNVAINNYQADLALVPEPQKKGSVIKETPNALPVIRTKKKNNNHLFSFIFRLETTDLFVLTLAACALGLLLMPEIIYVKDIYGGSYQRSNTMFKLVYQAFIMFGIVMGYGLSRLIVYNETKKQRILSVIALCFLVWTMGYFGTSVGMYMGDLHDPDKEGLNRTLDSYKKISLAESGYASTTAQSDSIEQTVLWALDNIPSDAVILQMCTTAYKPFATISAYTGNPTVLGWKNHEWLWRSNGNLDQYGNIACPEKVYSRADDVVTMYTSTDEAEVCALIEKYNVDYIYLGITETCNGMLMGDTYKDNGVNYRGTYYAKINTNYSLLESLGEIVYDGETEEKLGFKTLIIKLDRSKTAAKAQSGAEG